MLRACVRLCLTWSGLVVLARCAQGERVQVAPAQRAVRVVVEHAQDALPAAAAAAAAAEVAADALCHQNAQA